MDQFETKLRAAKAEIERTKIVSPIDGPLDVDPGQRIEARAEAAPVLVVAASDAEIEALFEKKDIGEAKIGDQVTVRAPAASRRPFVGTIMRIEPLSGEKPLCKVTVTVTDPDLYLTIGMNADVLTLDKLD